MKTLQLEAIDNGTISTYNQKYIWLTMLADCYCSNWYFALIASEVMFGTPRSSNIIHSFKQPD